MFLFQIIADFLKYSLSAECGWSVGGPENNYCPIHGTKAWDCLKNEKNCPLGNEYHCAKNYKGEWAEACAQEQTCRQGIKIENTL